MLKDISLKKTYSSANDNLLLDFYIPVLKQSTIYKRITGFFSSTSLLLAAQGIAHFFANGGYYQLISGVIVENKDYEAIVKGLKTAEEVIMGRITFNLDQLEDELEKDHLKILSWLISTNRLKIKIAVLPENATGLFHEKIGIFEDKNGNKISFSGSINESAAGWSGNIEEFKVFRGWIDEEEAYLKRDIIKFSDYWNNCINSFSVIDLPEALEKELLKIRPENEIDLKAIIKKIKDDKPEKRELHDFQKNAISKWKDNNFRGILEMATGTGKTFTSLGAVKSVYSDKKEYCAIIVVPYKHLVTQWLKDIKQELVDSVIIEVHGDARGWKEKLPKFLQDYSDGFIDKLVIIAVYDSLSSEEFIKKLKHNFNNKKTYIIIADEVHNFGAPEYSNGMVDNLKMRLGLSATPTRWFDEEGTQKLIDYFEKTVFEYDLKMAIANHYLTPYEYYPITVQMDLDEFEEYSDLTKKIIRKMSYTKNRAEEDIYLKLLTIQRSKILRNNKTKITAFKHLISDLKIQGKIDHLLVYCDSEDQMLEAQKIINGFGIISHRFTERESMDEREQILGSFDNGLYECLVAMKCLDEGVNVPSIKTAIILASSTNPREYVQRRGRVLRKFPGKDKAVIYDFIVIPPEKVEDDFFFSIEQKILKKELNRVQEFLDTASNKTFILKNLSDTMLKYNVYLD